MKNANKNSIKEKSSKKLTLLQATAINMTDMVGIGPFVVLSVVASAMPGNTFLYAWLAGSFLSFFDATVWAQLGATYPLAGGSYHFLKESFGPKWGRLMSFLFVWQTLIQAPLVIASAAIGFSQYAGYLFPLTEWSSKALSGSVVVTIVALLYRNISEIGKITVFLWAGVLFTLLSIILGGVYEGNFLSPIQHLNMGIIPNKPFFFALCASSVHTIYSYLGYYNTCLLGGEIKNPTKNIPLSMFLSIAGITVLYLLMNISVASVLPLEVIHGSKFVVSDFVEAIAGKNVANIATGLVLWVAFASVFSATLGYSRVPYAAAADGAFFPIFAKLHPTRNFPYVSLLALGGIAFIFSLLFKLKFVIQAIVALRILVQFIGQNIGLMLLVKRKGLSYFKWKMPLYPLPALIAIVLWSLIFLSTEQWMKIAAVLFIIVGVILYYLLQSFQKKDIKS